ncbi:MAG: nucleoside triphosphate pyrophosphohydrolase [Ignavibacteriales bacterium]|nr:nucleoside triphosphate pyrophosphohydrolase [Ignavibacteriales bacterium]MCF8305410.1 nucleoside triphosphate pyrophosphohydrolase [Ignavibacteriales bacterium]MCF8316093.1 nucleoside triphosphate pyrophosphohydrolase [Ignavibacteriales bacterium]MCF8436595.1 nucleoside triphosphate pyrophosphohydrolase [Ignavibacteriales bacterium]
MTGENFTELMAIMRKLRTDCPWDKEQTHDSIKAATLEEAYETVEAIDEKQYDKLKEELGDLLLHIVFHSVIAEDNAKFTIDDVIESISAKLIRRHPHVFGDTEVNGSKDIERNWEKIKLAEGRSSVLEGVPKNLHGLYRSFRIQQKVSKVGFDWKNKKDVWAKVLEEINELHEAEETGDKEHMEKEMGDLFFSLVNYSRFIGINPEDAIRITNEKFIRRFQFVEKKIADNGGSLLESTLEEMDKYWEESKKYY